MDGWKPLATLAREVGVPEPSARRYAHAFAEFVRSRRIGKTVLYAPELGELLRIAAAGFATGKRRDEVADDLAARFGQVHDVAPRGDAVTTPATLDRVDLAALVPLAERFLMILERGVAALEAVAANKPVQAPEAVGRVKGQVEGQTSNLRQSGASFPQKTRAEIVAEVNRLHQTGLGAGAVATAMRRAGWPTLSGRGRWAKGSVSRILKGAKND